LVVWTLTLPSESEGPSLIACAARLHRFNRANGLLSAPSWRTKPDEFQAVEGAVGEVQLRIGELSFGVNFTVIDVVAIVPPLPRIAAPSHPEEPERAGR
jgi:hypothetical protein